MAQLIDSIRFNGAAVAFGLSVSRLYQLEKSENFPARPRYGKLTRQWLEALRDWHIKRRGPLPEKARRLLSFLSVPESASESSEMSDA